MSDSHARLLAHCFLHLAGPSERLPSAWVGGADGAARPDRRRHRHADGAHRPYPHLDLHHPSQRLGRRRGRLAGARPRASRTGCRTPCTTASPSVSSIAAPLFWCATWPATPNCCASVDGRARCGSRAPMSAGSTASASSPTPPRARRPSNTPNGANNNITPDCYRLRPPRVPLDPRHSTAIADHVTVDFELGGRPIERRQLRGARRRCLQGRRSPDTRPTARASSASSAATCATSPLHAVPGRSTQAGCAPSAVVRPRAPRPLRPAGTVQHLPLMAAQRDGRASASPRRCASPHLQRGVRGVPPRKQPAPRAGAPRRGSRPG